MSISLNREHVEKLIFLKAKALPKKV